MNNTEDKTEIINIIKRQTDYNEETIIKKLEEHNNNIENILYEFNGINIKEKEEKQNSKLSTNQKIFKSIRDLL